MQMPQVYFPVGNYKALMCGTHYSVRHPSREILMATTRNPSGSLFSPGDKTWRPSNPLAQAVEFDETDGQTLNEHLEPVKCCVKWLQKKQGWAICMQQNWTLIKNG